jgi:hypothetical protein
MLRNVTPVVAYAATLNDIVLPIWMLTVGLVLIAETRSFKFPPHLSNSQ